MRVIDEYISRKKSSKEIGNEFWLVIKQNWDIVITTIFFFLIYFYVQSYFHVDEKYMDILKKVNDLLLTVSSIISAIIITFLTSKVLQIREEKLKIKEEYHLLTQKVHKFRQAIYVLFSSYHFWYKGLKAYMDKNYKDLNYYDVRKSVFVNGTPLSAPATAFINDTEFGDSKKLYLALKSFFEDGSFIDHTLYNEFDTELYYSSEGLELINTFDPTNSLYYYFNLEWPVFKNDFFFENVTTKEREKAKQAAHIINAERYDSIPFGSEFYGKLGSELQEYIFPRLYKLSLIMEEGLPASLFRLSVSLAIILGLGIIIPFFNILFTFNPQFTILSIASIVSILFYYCLFFHKSLVSEISVMEKG